MILSATRTENWCSVWGENKVTLWKCKTSGRKLHPSIRCTLKRIKIWYRDASDFVLRLVGCIHISHIFHHRHQNIYRVPSLLYWHLKRIGFFHSLIRMLFTVRHFQNAETIYFNCRSKRWFVLNGRVDIDRSHFVIQLAFCSIHCQKCGTLN